MTWRVEIPNEAVVADYATLVPGALVAAFAACAESLTPEPARRQLLGARSVDTMTTRQFDLAAQYRWPATLPERVLIDSVGRPTPVNAGQGVGSATTSEPAAAVLDKLARGAEDLLRRSRGYVD